MASLVHQSYDGLSRMHPTRDAIVHAGSGDSMTFEQLEVVSLSLARKLVTLGGGGSPITVAILSGRDFHLLSLYVGVSRLPNCSLLPLPNWYDASRSGMKQDKWESSALHAISVGEASIVLVDEDSLAEPWLANCGCRVFGWSEFLCLPETEIPDSQPMGDLPPILKLLSGGSTGSPKLHAVSHAMVLSELNSYPAVMGMSSAAFEVRVLQQSTLAWPASCMGQINIALALGGTVVVTSSRKAADLGAEISATNVNVIGGAPSQLSLLSDYLPLSLVAIFTWGERLPESLGRKLKSKAGRVIELLVATEYWLCMHCGDLSGEFAIVPNCTVEIVDPDESGIGQLSLSGPMVSGGSLLTSDLVKGRNGRISFVGRKDFLTKIGGNWFDVRELEAGVLAMGKRMHPSIVGAVALTCQSVHYLVLSVQADSNQPYNIAAWMDAVKSEVRRFSPLELTIRTISSPIPTLPNSGKIDRAAVLRMLVEIAAPRLHPHIAFSAARDRFFNELKSHARWSIGFAILLRRWVLAAPYMYLATLYLPNVGSGYLPRCRTRSTVAYLGYWLGSLFRDLPFGRAGLMVFLTLLARRSRFVFKLLVVWTMLGMGAAVSGGRLLAWPVTFWLGVGSDIRDESGYWFRARKWRYLGENLKFLMLSIPDAFCGTNFCASFDETVHTRAPRDNEGVDAATTKDIPGREEGTPERADGVPDEELVASVATETVTQSVPTTPPTAVDLWWSNSPVQYIGTSESSGTRPARTPPLLLSEDDGLSSFVRQAIACTVPSLAVGMSADSSLRGISSLQITELVQRLKHRVSLISARLVMDCETLGELEERIGALETIITPTNTASPTTTQYCKIQFSAGQINRVCRWMIRSRKVVDRERLRRAVEALVARHPLLRSELCEPKQLHSFVYDAGVMLANWGQFVEPRNQCSTHLSTFLGKCVHACWAKLAVYPACQLPGYWVDTISQSKVSDYEHFRRMIQQMRRDVEDSWFCHQNPISVHVFTLTATNEEYILISVKHSISDGNSAFPLMDDLALFYEGREIPVAIADPLPELEQRCYDGILANTQNPNRTSIRTPLFYSPEVHAIGGGYYRHYICMEPGAIALLRKHAMDQLQLSFDSVLLALIAIALMRTDESDRETFTLYCPLRDGPGESSLVGLLTDWRDITFVALPGASILDIITDVATRIRNREWMPTMSTGGAESVLINWMAFDGAPRLGDKSWEPFHLDKITQRWNKMDIRDFDYLNTPSGRCRSMSLEQYDQNGQWWLRFDVATRIYPAAWMMKFSEEMSRTFSDILNQPLTSK